MSGNAAVVHGEKSPHGAAYSRDAGLADLWGAQVRARPSAMAIHWGVKRVTYAELDRRANRLANALQELGVGEETPVAVGMKRGLEALVAHVAIAKLGATCVPLDLQHPPERIAFILEDCGATVLLTETVTEEARCASGAAARLCLERDGARVSSHPESFESLRGGAERRVYVLYTSGTTGRPKGIEILARGIHRLVLDTDYVSFGPEDRVAQVTNHSFDLALFEIWGALLNGASLVVLSRASVLDAAAFRDAVRDTGVTVLDISTALFNMIAQACPDAFRGLRYVVIGGERANPRLCRAVLECAPPGRLINGYGPTESTTYATAHEVRLKDVLSGAIPIGRPIRGTDVFILDEGLLPVAKGQVGELCISGLGLARGYVNRPELTAERFPVVSGLVPGDDVRVYRTGDLARWNEDGTLDFLGRADFQVKIRGHRIELEEVSRSLLESGLLWDAVVTLQEREDGEKSLAAFVVPKEPMEGLAAKLQDFMRAKVSEPMVPSRIVELERLPMTVNGKVDRAALPRVEPATNTQVRALIDAAQVDPLEAGVSAIWAELLGVEGTSRDDDFLRLGGNSLLLGRMATRLRERFGVGLSAYALHEARTLGGFVDGMRQALAGGDLRLRAAEGPETWREHARLPGDIQPPSEPRLIKRPRPLQVMEHVFLTGATGFMGAFVLRDLLRMSRAQVDCLVRARDVATGHARLRRSLEKYGLWEEGFAPRILPVLGDLGTPRFGMGALEYQALAERSEALFHVGAHVNYVQPYEGHMAANVDGTTEVLRLSALGGATPVHYVSTIAVFGPTGYFTGTQVLLEGEGLDRHLDGLRYDLGYAASKWVAEQRVWEAVKRGLPVNVYRPGFIMGDSRTGAGNADDFVGRLIRGCLQIGCYPDLPRQRKEFVPVDFVSHALLGIAAREGAAGKAYHLVPPTPGDSVEMNDFFGLLAECGHPLSRVPYDEWVERLMRDSRLADNALCALVPMLYEQVYGGGATRWEVYEGMPVYDARNTSAAIAGAGIEFHKLDRVLLSRYLDHWKQRGLL
ncbi:amino acid adenylation domain-containing protein [Corallococcus terminator]